MNTQQTYKNQYTYFDYRSGVKKLVLTVNANSILEADALAKEAGVNANQMSCCIGGRLQIFKVDEVVTRRQIQSRKAVQLSNGKIFQQEASFVYSTYESKMKVNKTFPSLNTALEELKKTVSIYRYNPEYLFLWVVGGISTIVQNYDPHEK